MNKLLKSLLGLTLMGATALQAQIEINDNLSITGFLDMSMGNVSSEIEDDPNLSPASQATLGSDESFFNLDQAEIDFLLTFDQISGQIDLNYLGGNDGDFDLEQAFLSYDLGDGSNIEAGKFLSYMGWETAEPTGLYQFSYAYDITGTIPGYHNGVRYNYNDDFMSFGLSLLDSVYSPDGSVGDSEYGVEAKIAIYPVEGLTLFLGYAKDSYDNPSSEMDLINFWASYEVGNATYALEWNDYDFGGDSGSQWLVMANYGLTDTAGLTFRISQDEQDMVHGDLATKYTISPNWSVNDNLGMLFEISQTDYGIEGNVTSVAFETIFTF